MSEFDENAAVAAIKNALGDRAAKYSDDQILNVIDMIWDFYEENGLLDIDCDEEIEENALFDDLLGYTGRMLKKDKHSGIDPDDIEDIVRAEIAYESTIDPLAD
ncbi:MAG: hypothetical protein HFJ94_08025 [Muribaculaceae bacterium]|jgi:hypothetical protein|nr:hypothetical protein [Muribaculaceae bacterium]